MTTQPGYNPPPAPLPAPAPPSSVVASFAAVCATCSWEGRPRRDSLTALRDFDAHVATDDHAWAVLHASMAADDEGEP